MRPDQRGITDAEDSVLPGITYWTPRLAPWATVEAPRFGGCRGSVCMTPWLAPWAIVEISALPEEPVDFAKCPFASTIQFPRSEIAATIQWLMSAYARY